MKFPALQAATAVALVLGATSAYAQGQTKPDEGKGAPPAAQTEVPKSGAPKQGMSPEPKEKATKGSAQSEPKDKGGKGSVQREPTGPAGKGAQTEPREKSKGSAQTSPPGKSKDSAQTEPKDKASRGAEKGTAPSTKSSERQNGAGSPKEGTAAAPASGRRVQLSEQQRTSVHQTFMKERNLNRVTKVNFTVNVGARVPRNVRLQPLPATVISIVPQYRSYRYFVVDDRICIVEPSTYEVVEIVTVSGQTTERGGSMRLALSDDERALVVREIDIHGGSTLALGGLSEGADVPRNVELHGFPEAVLDKVSKLKGYRYFTAENRIAIVDPQEGKVRLIIEDHR